MIDCARLLADPTLVPSDQAPPKKADAKAWLELFLAARAAESSRAELRDLVRAAWALAQKVTHGGNVRRVDAFAAAQATVLVVRTLQQLDREQRGGGAASGRRRPRNLGEELLLAKEDERVWKAEGYETWLEYCYGMFGVGRAQAFRHVHAAVVEKQVSEAAGTPVRLRESYTRAISRDSLPEVVALVRDRIADADPQEAAASYDRGSTGLCLTLACQESEEPPSGPITLPLRGATLHGDG
jgi:hypothetical protein